MDRKSLLLECRFVRALRCGLLAAAVIAALASAPQSARAGCPVKDKGLGQQVISPPPTVLPPVGFPPPAVYGFPTTMYRSGWYNTHYWPRKTYHHGFYGDYWQWGYFPGY